MAAAALLRPRRFSGRGPVVGAEARTVRTVRSVTPQRVATSSRGRPASSSTPPAASTWLPSGVGSQTRRECRRCAGARGAGAEAFLGGRSPGDAVRDPSQRLGQAVRPDRAPAQTALATATCASYTGPAWATERRP